MVIRFATGVLLRPGEIGYSDIVPLAGATLASIIATLHHAGNGSIAVESSTDQVEWREESLALPDVSTGRYRAAVPPFDAAFARLKFSAGPIEFMLVAAAAEVEDDS